MMEGDMNLDTIKLWPVLCLLSWAFERAIGGHLEHGPLGRQQVGRAVIGNQFTSHTNNSRIDITQFTTTTKTLCASSTLASHWMIPLVDHYTRWSRDDDDQLISTGVWSIVVSVVSDQNQHNSFQSPETLPQARDLQFVRFWHCRARTLTLRES